VEILAIVHAVSRVAAEGGAGNPAGNLGINTALILAQIVNFIFLLVFLNGLVIKPVLASLEARRKRIDESLDNARKADERLANVEKDYQARLTQADADAVKARTEVIAAAQADAQRVRAEAATEAERIKDAARADALNERNQLLADSRNQIVALVMAATNKLVGESLTESRQKAIITDFFAKVPEGISSVEGASVVVVSALPLNSREQNRVKTELGVATADFEVDPSILGGLIVRIGDKVVDGSVSSKVNALRSSLNA
jgi:F-type H+-transporting ATPase subunit b